MLMAGKQKDLGSSPLRLSFLFKCCALNCLVVLLSTIKDIVSELKNSLVVLLSTVKDIVNQLMNTLLSFCSPQLKIR